jgi:hypothetical protein
MVCCFPVRWEAPRWAGKASGGADKQPGYAALAALNIASIASGDTGRKKQ